MSEKNPENNQIPEEPKPPHNPENKEVGESSEKKAERLSLDKNERSERQQEAEESLQTLFDSKTETKEKSLPENTLFAGTPVDKEVKYFMSDTPSRLGKNIFTDTVGLLKGTVDSTVTTGKLALDTVADMARLVFSPIKEIQRTRAYLKSLDEVQTKV